MNAGKLRHRITIERRSSLDPDENGGVPIRWVMWQQLYARIELLTGRELDFARSFVDTVSHKVTVRYYPGIQVNDRIVYAGHLLTINAVLNKEFCDEEITLLCTEYRDDQDPAIESSSSSSSSSSLSSSSSSSSSSDSSSSDSSWSSESTPSSYSSDESESSESSEDSESSDWVP